MFTAELGRLEKEGGDHLKIMVGHLLCKGREEKLPEVSRIALIQARYVAHRLDGDGHIMADMLAHAKPPKARTDREFLMGHVNGNQFEKSPGLGNTYKAIADEAGVDITGKVYYGSLAEYPGDPRAWVSGRGDVERICLERGWNCSGAVNVKGARPVENPNIGVADDLVYQRVESQLDKMDDGQRAKADIGEMCHEARESMKPHWAD